jgi:hypothetical protein
METIEFVIKIEDEVPVGHPLLASNVSQVFELSKVTMKTLLEIGHSPFIPSIMPEDEIRRKVIDNGYLLGQDGFVRPHYHMEEKSFDEIDLDSVLEDKLSLLKEELQDNLKRPIVSTSLGFSVDGGVEDLISFGIGKKREYLSIRGSDNVIYSIDSVDDYDIIIDSIESIRLSLLKRKWDIEEKLKSTDLSIQEGLDEFDAIDIVLRPDDEIGEL